MGEIEKEEKYTLSQLRALNNLTKEELAKRSGVTSRTIISYEMDVKKLRNGKYSTLEKLAKALGVKVKDIFLDPVSEKPKKFI
ncbi:MAG: helix-turn-helix domain-containing protein [Streptococcaceae bacterium]|jgi:transcriptional regulator with XRE-family HTH domain|nr:helix-turn-helix domain-containing protein [Streptococcaceae bacterium]